MHYSKKTEIINRASIFTLLWLVIFIWTIFSYKLTGPIAILFNFVPSSYLPPLTWLVYILYYLFPSKKYFNGKTRFFLKLLVVDMFKSPCKKFEFIIPWATDQFLSFAVSLRDFFYSACYTIVLFQDGNILEMTCQTNLVVVVLENVMIFLPLYLRMGQCLNQMHFAKDKYGKLKNYANFFKYLMGTITVIMSLLIKTHQAFFWIWVGFVISATIIAYYWDIKYDFGLLETEVIEGKAFGSVFLFVSS